MVLRCAEQRGQFAPAGVNAPAPVAPFCGAATQLVDSMRRPTVWLWIVVSSIHAAMYPVEHTDFLRQRECAGRVEQGRTSTARSAASSDKAPELDPGRSTAQPCESDALKKCTRGSARSLSLFAFCRHALELFAVSRWIASRRLVRLECLSENRMAPRGRCERALSQLGRAEAPPERPASQVPAVLRREPVRGEMVKCGEGFQLSPAEK